MARSVQIDATLSDALNISGASTGEVAELVELIKTSIFVGKLLPHFKHRGGRGAVPVARDRALFGSVGHWRDLSIDVENSPWRRIKLTTILPKILGVHLRGDMKR